MKTQGKFHAYMEAPIYIFPHFCCGSVAPRPPGMLPSPFFGLLLVPSTKSTANNTLAGALSRDHTGGLGRQAFLRCAKRAAAARDSGQVELKQLRDQLAILTGVRCSTPQVTD